MNEDKYYIDHKGYKRFKTGKKGLLHRYIAKKEIYEKDRKRYPFPFHEYQVHHKDKNKSNNNPNNLELLPIREHELKSGIQRYEYPIILSLLIFFLTAFSWYSYISWASNYAFNSRDVIFMIGTSILALIGLYLVNRKKKEIRYV